MRQCATEKAPLKSLRQLVNDGVDGAGGVLVVLLVLDHIVGRDDLDADAAIVDIEALQHVRAGDDEGERLDIIGVHLNAGHAVEVICDELPVEVHLDDVRAQDDAGVEIVDVFGLHDEVAAARERLGDGNGQIAHGADAFARRVIALVGLGDEACAGVVHALAEPVAVQCAGAEALGVIQLQLVCVACGERVGDEHELVGGEIYAVVNSGAEERNI